MFQSDSVEFDADLIWNTGVSPNPDLGPLYRTQAYILRPLSAPTLTLTLASDAGIHLETLVKQGRRIGQAPRGEAATFCGGDLNNRNNARREEGTAVATEEAGAAVATETEEEEGTKTATPAEKTTPEPEVGGAGP